MKTLQELWKEYRDNIYPPDIPAEQNRECYQAFMCGAFSVLSQMAEAADCPETDEAESAWAKHLTAIHKEGQQWCALRGIALNQPRN